MNRAFPREIGTLSNNVILYEPSEGGEPADKQSYVSWKKEVLKLRGRNKIGIRNCMLYTRNVSALVEC